MATVSLKLVTIVAEPVLEEQIATSLRRLGATGYTVTEAHGAGSRGMRASVLRARACGSRPSSARRLPIASSRTSPSTTSHTTR